jgi:hypothetical protein
MNSNATSTPTTTTNTYVKLAGTTSSTTLQKFSSPTSNRLTYTGKRDISARVFISVTGTAPGNNVSYSIALAKGGVIIASPHASTGTMSIGQAFLMVLDTEVNLVTNDYLEVYIKNNTGTTAITITDLQFRAVE